MGLFPIDAEDGDEVTNTYGTTFKYVAVDDKWIILNTIKIDNTPYNEATWNDNSDAATKDAIRDKIETMETEIDGNCTTVEAHAYVEANALTLENDLAMGTHKITGLVDPVTDQEAATKKYVDDNAGDISQATYDADNAFGVGNKRWINGQLEGQFPAPYQSYTTGTWVNTGATDYRLVFGVPLPFIIGSKNLYITNVKIGVHDADASNYLDRVYMNGAIDFDTQSGAFLDDGTNRTAPGEHTYVVNELIGGVYEKISLQIFVFATNAGNFDLSYCQFEYYYA